MSKRTPWKRQAAAAFHALKSHMVGGIAVATWNEPTTRFPRRAVIAVDGILNVDDVRAALRPLIAKREALR